MRKTMKKITITHYLLIGLCLVSLSLSVFTRINRPSIVVFDVKRTLTQFQQQLIEKEVSQTQHQLYLTQFALALERATHQYSVDNNVVILTTPAVVAGAEDITHNLQKSIIKHYQDTQQASNYEGGS